MDLGYQWWRLRRKVPVTNRKRRQTEELLRAHGFIPRADGSWVKPASGAEAQEPFSEG